MEAYLFNIENMLLKFSKEDIEKYIKELTDFVPQINVSSYQYMFIYDKCLIDYLIRNISTEQGKRRMKSIIKITILFIYVKYLIRID